MNSPAGRKHMQNARKAIRRLDSARDKDRVALTICRHLKAALRAEEQAEANLYGR